MIFTAKYRATDGSLREESVEVDSRGAAFAAMKSRGISPLSIRAGGNVPSSGGLGALGKSDSVKSSCDPGCRRTVRLVLTVLFVLLAGGALYFWFSSQEKPLPPEQPVAKPKAPVKNAEPQAMPKDVATKSLSKRRHRKPKQIQSATVSVGTPPDLRTFDDAPPGYGEINGSNIWPRALFKTREENMIAGLLTAKPGSRVLINHFIPGEEARLLASLDAPVEFEDIDTPEERKVKEYMIDVKKELKEAVANGEKITDIVQGLRDELNNQANYRDKLRMSHALLLKEGTPQEAEEFRQEANKILSEYGMEPIPLRSTQRARLGLAQ